MNSFDELRKKYSIQRRTSSGSSFDDLRRKYNAGSRDHIEEIGEKYVGGSDHKIAFTRPRTEVPDQPDTKIVAGTGLGVGMVLPTQRDVAQHVTQKVNGGTGLGTGIVMPTQQQADRVMAQVAKENHEEATQELKQLRKDRFASWFDPSSRNPESENFKTNNDWVEELKQAKDKRDKAAQTYYEMKGRVDVGALLDGASASDFARLVEIGKQLSDYSYESRMTGAADAIAPNFYVSKEDEARSKAVQKATTEKRELIDKLTRAGHDKETVEKALDYMMEQYEAIRAGQVNEEFRAFADAYPVAGTLLRVAAAPAQGVDYATAALGNIGHNSTANLEKYKPLTEADFTFTGVTQGLTEGASADMGNVGKFLYNTGMSIADSALLVSTIGPAASVVLGMGAASNTAKDVIERGGTNNQALAAGLAAGAAEVIFEKVSIDNLLKIKSVTDAKVLVSNVLKQAGTEASEEALTEIANIISDAAIMGQDSSFNAAVKAYQKQGMSEEAAKQKAVLDNIAQIGLAAAGGALSGGVMGGGASVGSYIYNRAYQDYLGKNFSQDRVSVLSVAQEYAEGSQTRDMANKIHAAVKSAMDNGTEPRVSDNQWGRLLQSMENEKTQFGPKVEDGVTAPEVEQALHPDEAVMSPSAQAFMDAGDDAKTADTKSKIFDRIRNGDTTLRNADLRALDLESASTRAVFKSVLGVELPPVSDGHQLNRAALNAAKAIADARAQAQAQQAEIQERVAENEQAISEAEQQARAIEAEAAEMAKQIPQLAEAEQGVQVDTGAEAGVQERSSLGEIPTETNVPQAGVSGAAQGSANSLLKYINRVHSENTVVRERTQAMTVQALNQMLESVGSRSRVEIVHDGKDGFNAMWTPDGKIQVNADRLDTQFAIHYTLTHELFHEASKQKGGEESEWTRAAAKELIALGESGKIKIPGYENKSWSEYKAATREAQIRQHMNADLPSIRAGFLTREQSRQRAEAKLTEDFLNEEYAADVLRSVFAQTGNLKLLASERRTVLTKIRDWLQSRFTELLKGGAENKGDLMTEMNDLVKKVNDALTNTAERGTDKAETTTTQEGKYSAEGREEIDAGGREEGDLDPRGDDSRGGSDNRENNARLEEDDLRLIGDAGLWAVAAVHAPEKGSGAQLEQDFALAHKVKAFVLDDQAMLDNGHRVGFTRNGVIFLSDKIQPNDGEPVAKHELVHAMKQLEFDPYNRFLMGVEGRTIRGRLLDSMLQATMEHVQKTAPGLTTTNPEHLHDLSLDMQKHIWDEFTAIAYGTWADDPEASAEGFGLAFVDPVEFMAELDALLEDFAGRDASLDRKYSAPTPADINTPEFREWFNDDSGELTNPDGTPKIFLRGSPLSGPTKFRDYRESYSPGIFFTQDQYTAENYASARSTRDEPTEFVPRNLTSWNEAFQWVDNGGLGNFVSLDREGPEWVFAKRNALFPMRWETVATYSADQAGLDKFNAEYGDLMRNEVFGTGKAVNPGYMRAYLSATKTKVIDAQGRIWLNADGNWSKTDDVVREAWADGYDCVVIKNVQDGGEELGLEFDDNDNYVTVQKPIDVVVVRDSGQVKSVYNTGSFDRQNPDVRYSAGGLNSDERGGMMKAQEEVRINGRDNGDNLHRRVPETLSGKQSGEGAGKHRTAEAALPEQRSSARDAGQDVHRKDSEGRSLTANQLKRLNGTAIVDEDARPLAVYHFTPNEGFDTFARGDIGFHFGTKEQAANRQKALDAENGRTIRAYLNIKNPYHIRLDLNAWQPSHIGLYLWSEGVLTDEQWNEVQQLGGRGYDAPGADRLRSILSDAGYDGFVYPNVVEGEGNSYIALYDEQIVWTNRGQKYSVSGKPSTGGNTGNVNPETGFQRGSVADSFMRMWNVGAQDEALSMLESVITRLAQLEADASERRLADLRRAVLSPRVTENIAERNRERIERLITKYGMMPQTSAAQQEARVPKQIDDETYVAGAVQTVMAAGVTTELIRDELAQDILSGNAGVTYARIGDRATLDQVDKEYEKYGHDVMMKQWKAKVNGNETIGKLDIARAEKLYVEMAGSKNPDVPAVLELVAEIAAAGTQAGQAVQAMTLLKKMTPTGQLYYIQKAVDRLNKDPRQKSPITINEKLAEKLVKAQTRAEINAAVDELINDIAQQVPVSLADKWNTWRYFAMLGNPRTHIRNLLGNAIFSPARLAKDAIGTLLERALPQNQRTKALTASEELREFAEQDAEEMQDILRGGGKYNPSDMIRDKRKIFKRAEWLNKATQKNSELLEKEDWIFLGRAYQRALAGFLSARGITDTDSLLDTPEGRKTLNEAREYAVHEAQRATYRDMSKLAGTLNHLKRNNKALGLFLDGIVPFTKTPINIVKRGFEYSPLGLTKTIYDAVNRGVAVKQIEKGETVKRDFKSAAEIIDELSANLTGTGVALLGALLSSMGLITAGLGADDEDKFKELYGEQAYSLNIPGVGSYTIDWTAPVALPLFVGAEIYNALSTDYSDVGAEQVLDAVMDGMASILEPMLSLSMLDGVNDALSANKYGDSEDALWTLLSTVGSSYVAQGVPTVLGQLSRTIDPNRRTTFTKKGEGDVKGMLQRFWQSSVQGKVPFYENEKMAYIDAWGRADTTGSIVVRAVENFLSPGYINANRKTDVEAELERLAAELKDTSVMPDRAQKYFTVNRETYAMSQDEYQAHLIDRGQTSYALVNDFLHDPAYDRIDDAGRAKVIGYIYDYAAQSAKYHTTEAYERDTWIVEMGDYISRGGDAVDYLTMKAQTNSSTTMSEVAYQRNDLTAYEMGSLILGDVGSSQRAPSSFADPYAKGYVYELNDEQQARYTETYDRLFNERFPDLYASDEYRDATPEERKKLVSDLRADVVEDVKYELADWLWEQGVESKLK